MRVTPTSLPEVLTLEAEWHDDARGAFMEIWREDKLAAAGIPARIVQANLTTSRKDALRGLHFQEPDAQDKLITVLAGVIFDVAVDIRRGSPRFGRWIGIELSAANRRQLWIPRGFAHGFCALADDTQVQYACTGYYAPAHDRTIRWNDPALAIDWPVKAPILSPRDTAAPALAAAPVLPTYRIAP
ncbi:MAG: dTDP-4-dehydrorhamnose 3,5-epimerase [Alphaproteobacteria bacterium]